MRHARATAMLAVLHLGLAGCAAQPPWRQTGVVARPDQPAVLQACTQPVVMDPRNEMGQVTVRYIVEPSGRVDRATVHMVSAMDPAVSNAMIERVRTYAASCIYRPALLNGEPVRTQVQQTVSLR